MRWAKEKNPIQKRKKHSRKIDMELLAKDVEEYPDDYQRERAARFGVSKHGIYWALKKLGVPIKKSFHHPKAEHLARKTFETKMNEHRESGKTTVYIDESGFAEDMPRRYGYAVKGKTLFWKT